MSPQEKALRQVVRDQKVGLYLLNSGDPCAPDLAGIVAILQVVLTAARSSKKCSEAECLKLKQALNKAVSCMVDNVYESAYTPEIANGLDEAMRMASKIKPKDISRAWAQTQV